MATHNFYEQDNFPLFVTTIFDYSEEIDEETGETICYEGDPYLMQELKEEVDAFNRELEYYQLELQDGYYSGVQLVLRDYDEVHESYQELSNRFTMKEWNKERREERQWRGYNYYYPLPYRQQQKAEQAELKKILAFVRKRLFEEYGFEEYVCVAAFSNGDAWYDKVSNERAKLKSVANGYAA